MPLLWLAQLIVLWVVPMSRSLRRRMLVAADVLYHDDGDDGGGGGDDDDDERRCYARGMQLMSSW